jgi:hypothetical protein
MFFNNIHVKLAIHFSLVLRIVTNNLYLSKLAAQMVTSTSSENLSLHLYESRNKIFNFGTTKTLILHAPSIFFLGGSPYKNVEEKNIFHENPVEVESFDGTYLFMNTRVCTHVLYIYLPHCAIIM